MPTNPQKICILHTEWSDGWGGQEVRVLTEMVGMRNRGHRVILATRLHCQIAAKAKAANIEVVFFPFSGKFDLRTIWGLTQLIKKEHVDLCNTHSGIDSWVGGLAARIANIALIRTRHLDIPLKRSWHNFVHYLPDRIVTCGENTLRKLRDQYQFPADQLASIPTGVDFSSFAPRNKRSQTRGSLGLSDQDFAVLMVGVIRRVKRHDIALRGFALALTNHPNMVLVLAGDGPGKSKMEKLAAELDIAKQVHFLGHRSDVPDLMYAADTLILTSDSEGIPQAVTQALGSGLPVIATHVGGVPELIKDQVTGVLIDKDSPAAVSDALDILIRNPEKAASMAASAKTFVRSEFSLDVMLEKTEKIYSEVMKARSS